MNEMVYSKAVSAIYCLFEAIEDYGITIAKIKEINERDNFHSFSNFASFPNKENLRKYINTVVNDAKAIDGAIIDDTKNFDALEKIAKKYNLSNPDDFINKFNELIVKDECLKSIANSVNNIAPNTISDTASLITYVNELVKDFANFKQNSNTAFVNVSELMNENAMLKAQLAQLQNLLQNK